MKNKNKGNSFKKIKIILGLLVLVGGLVVAMELAQKNQENRSKAMQIIDGGTSVSDYYKKGSFPYVGFNPLRESGCLAINGICASFDNIWPEGTPCKVGSNYGATRRGLCPGNNYVLCCSPQVKAITPTPSSLPGLGQACGISKTGICINTNLPLNSVCKINSTRNGKVAYGYCSGPSTVRCCQ